MKCPLNNQDIESSQPLDQITAESLRECVKIFEGLPYSPKEAETAEYIATQISKLAKLGFTEFCTDRHLSDKLVEHLRSKGLHVIPHYMGAVMSKTQTLKDLLETHMPVFVAIGAFDEEVNLLRGTMPEAYVAVFPQKTILSWAEKEPDHPAPSPDNPYPIFRSIQEARESMAGKLEEQKEKDKVIWEALREKYIIHSKEPMPQRDPPPSGCLSLFLAIPTAALALFCLL